MIQEVEIQPEIFQKKKKTRWFSVDFFWLECIQLGSGHIHTPLLCSAGYPSQLGSPGSFVSSSKWYPMLARIPLTCLPLAHWEAQDVASPTGPQVALHRV